MSPPQVSTYRRLWETQNYEEWKVWWPGCELEELDYKIKVRPVSRCPWRSYDCVKFILGDRSLMRIL